MSYKLKKGGPICPCFRKVVPALKDKIKMVTRTVNWSLTS